MILKIMSMYLYGEFGTFSSIYHFEKLCNVFYYNLTELCQISLPIYILIIKFMNTYDQYCVLICRCITIAQGKTPGRSGTSPLPSLLNLSHTFWVGLSTLLYTLESEMPECFFFLVQTFRP